MPELTRGARGTEYAGRRSVVIGACVFVVLACLVIGLVRVYPFRDDVNPRASAGNDWLLYEQFAENILDKGLQLSAVPGPYWIPGGFLYNYFIAAIYALFGRNPSYVYVAQHVCIGISSVLMFFFARRAVAPPLALGFLFACTAMNLVNFRWWSILLLSENLAIVLYPPILLLLASGVERRSLVRIASGGVFAGLLVLSRPNMLAALPLLALVLLFVHGRFRDRLGRAAVFVLPAVAVVFLLSLRNYAVTGHLFSARYGALLPTGDVGSIASMLGTRLLYCAGFLPGGLDLSGPEMVFHKRLILLTVVTIVAVIVLIVRRRFGLAEWLCLALIAAAYGTFAIMPALGGYGLRFQLPYAALLLYFAVRALDVTTRASAPR